MAKELENETEKLSKEDKRMERFAEKTKKAQEKKAALEEQIQTIKAAILEENDEKTKKKLRRQRDDLIMQKDAIVIKADEVVLPMAPAMKKKINAAIAVAVVIALLAVYVATGAARHGMLSEFSVPQKTLTGFVLTDADGKKHTIKVATYNFYFASYYNQLRQSQSYMSQLGTGGDDVDFSKKFSDQMKKTDDKKEQTWAEYMEETVTDNIKKTYTYYYAAVKANNGKEPAIKDSQQKEIEDNIKQLKDDSSKYGYTVSAYLKKAYGDGVDEALFRKESKIEYISRNYQEDYQEELNSKEFSNKEYKQYLKEHREDLLSVDVKYFECTNEDDAKAFVKALNADGSNFAELASKYSEDDYHKAMYKNPEETTYKNVTRSTFISMQSAIGTADTAEDGTSAYRGLDWLYAKKRTAGESKNFSTSVVYLLKPAYVSDVKTVNVRHILIKPEDKEKEKEKEENPSLVTGDITMETATKEQKADAKKQAAKILKEFEAGEQTPEAFGALAKKYTADSNGDDGGLYKNVVPNTMVPAFNAWCFDDARKAGDTAIVETQFGYHVMYFDAQNDMEAWKYTAQQALASDDTSEAIEKFEKKFTIKKSWLGSRFFEIDTDIDNG